MKAIHERQGGVPGVAGAIAFALLSLLILGGCPKGDRDKTASDTATSTSVSGADSTEPAPDAAQDKPTPEPTFAGDPDGASRAELTAYIGSLKWRKNTRGPVTTSDGETLTVTLESEAGAYLVDSSGLARGRIVGRLRHESGDSWKDLGLSPNDTVYFWLRGRIPRQSGKRDSVYNVSSGKMWFIKLVGSSVSWKRHGLVYEHHGTPQYPPPPSGKFRRLTHQDGRYQFSHRGELPPGEARHASSAPWNVHLATYSPSSVHAAHASLLQTEFLPWDACSLGCCAHRH